MIYYIQLVWYAELWGLIGEWQGRMESVGWMMCEGAGRQGMEESVTRVIRMRKQRWGLEI